MNPIIIIVIILLIGSSIFFYFFTKTTSQIPKEPPLTTEEPPLTTEEPPLTTEEPKPEELSCLIINEDDYQFDNKVILGSELLNKKNKILESFVLSGIIYTDPSLLDPNKTYLVGTRTKSNIKSPAKNGGTECPDYPITIYKLI
jgi:hypothetical protein